MHVKLTQWATKIQNIHSIHLWTYIIEPDRFLGMRFDKIKKGRKSGEEQKYQQTKECGAIDINEREWVVANGIPYISICLSVSVILIPSFSFSDSTIIYCWWWAFCSKMWTWGGISGANKSVKAILYCRYLCRNQLFTLFSSI